MDIVDNAKTIYALVKKLGDLDLLEKMADLRDEIFELREENRNLKEKLSEREKYDMVFKDNTYWDNNKNDGPYCSKCWDDNKKAIRLQTRDSDNYCPSCKAYALKTTHNQVVKVNTSRKRRNSNDW